jgi:hypothetical protein
MAADRPAVAVAPIDWSQFRRNSGVLAGKSLLADLVVPGSARDTAARESDILARLREVRSEAREELLTLYLQEQVADVLGSQTLPLPDCHVGLLQMGMDSIMAIEMRNRLEARLGMTVPVQSFLQDSSIAELVPQLLVRLTEADPELASPVVPSPAKDELVSGEL